MAAEATLDKYFDAKSRLIKREQSMSFIFSETTKAQYDLREL